MLAGVCILVLIGWRLMSNRGQRLFPPQRVRAAPWGGLEIGLAVFGYFFWAQAIGSLLLGVGFFGWLYGPDFISSLNSEATSEAHRFASIRVGIWASLVAVPFQVGTILLLFRLASGTRPYQLGLNFGRFGSDVAVACAGWLLCTPIVFGVNIVATLCDVWLGGHPQQHPLTQMIESQPLPIELVIVVTTAGLTAPVLEELLFRGVLQPWLARRSWGGDAAMAGSMGMACVFGYGSAGWSPIIFVAAMLPGYLVIGRLAGRWVANPQTARALYATSLLFGTLHASVWPTPVPLFLLGIVLGFLAYRTQSLVAPMVLHGLFNAVTCIMFFYIAT